MKKPKMTVECKICDVCLPNYFGGHHLAWVCVPAYKMTFKALREALHWEVNQGAFGGSNELIRDYADHHEIFIKKAHAAINRDIVPAIKGKRLVFADIEQTQDEDSFDHVPMAYFVFTCDIEED